MQLLLKLFELSKGLLTRLLLKAIFKKPEYDGDKSHLFQNLLRVLLYVIILLGLIYTDTVLNGNNAELYYSILEESIDPEALPAKMELILEPLPQN